jgi:hypothetical protein
MTLSRKFGYTLMAAAVAASVIASPVSADAAPRSLSHIGPFCPGRAIPMGTWYFSYVGGNGHHYDLYRGLPFSPFGYGTVDCDS